MAKRTTVRSGSWDGPSRYTGRDRAPGPSHSGDQERQWKSVAACRRLLFLPDGKRFVSVDGPYTRLWKLDAEASILRMGHYARDVTALATSSDGKHIATGTTSGAVRLWKLPD